MAITQLQKLQKEISPYIEQLIQHPLYQSVKTLQHVQTFAEYHVFAVWDFMSLLKSLQLQLTSVKLPWTPVGSANTRFLINEIVTGEECDVDESNVRMSHFEMYLQAMQQMGANTTAIEQLLLYVQQSSSVKTAMQQLKLPLAVQEFTGFTFDTIEQAPIHVQAAVFTFGREDLIPQIFLEMVSKLSENHKHTLDKLTYYLNRHIEVDGGHHSQLATEMVIELCGKNEQKWFEATTAAQKALQKRLILWDAIYHAIQARNLSAAQ